MKLISDLLKNKKKPVPNLSNDQETIFFVFRKVVREEFGNIGEENFLPDHFSSKSGSLFVKSSSASWSSELWMNRGRIVKIINDKLGSSVVTDIKIKA